MCNPKGPIRARATKTERFSISACFVAGLGVHLPLLMFSTIARACYFSGRRGEMVSMTRSVSNDLAGFPSKRQFQTGLPFASQSASGPSRGSLSRSSRKSGFRTPSMNALFKVRDGDGGIGRVSPPCLPTAPLLQKEPITIICFPSRSFRYTPRSDSRGDFLTCLGTQREQRVV
jgi:hypothetical protein